MGQLRVSCAAFCRIEHEGRYLFILNRVRAYTGKYVITPLGGTLWHFEPPILPQIGAEPEDRSGCELRFYIQNDEAETRLATFRRWFNRRVERERDPFRELVEELVEEQGVLSELSREDVSFRYAGALERRAQSDRPGARVAETQFFWEVFNVTFTNPDVKRQVLDADRERGVFWLTPAEARQDTPICCWRGKAVDVRLADVLHVNGKK